jgi:hypothetical protein
MPTLNTMGGTRFGRGRPQKYGRAARAVTVRLPEDVLERLESLDEDIGRAIVQLVEGQWTAQRRRSDRPAAIASYGNRGVILVKPARVLKRLPGVELVPVGSGRALISLDRPLLIPNLELAVRDSIEGTDITTLERQALKAIAEILRQARSSRTMSVKERTIIVLESKRR